MATRKKFNLFSKGLQKTESFPRNMLPSTLKAVEGIQGHYIFIENRNSNLEINIQAKLNDVNDLLFVQLTRYLYAAKINLNMIEPKEHNTCEVVILFSILDRTFKQNLNLIMNVE